MKSIEVVFQSSVHLLFVFHVAKNVGVKCKEFAEVNKPEHVIELRNKDMYLKMMFKYEKHFHHFELLCANIYAKAVM